MLNPVIKTLATLSSRAHRDSTLLSCLLIPNHNFSFKNVGRISLQITHCEVVWRKGDYVGLVIFLI